MKRILTLTVSIVLLLSSCRHESAPEPALPSEAIIDGSTIESYFIGSEDEFRIGATTDTILICKKGSTIIIPENAWVDEYGNPVTGPVKITLRDYRKKSDHLFSGTQTVSKYDLLHMAGLCRFSVKRWNIGHWQKVQLAPGKKLIVELKSDIPTDPLMQPYTWTTDYPPVKLIKADSSLKLTVKPDSYLYSISKISTDWLEDMRLQSGRADVYNGIQKTVNLNIRGKYKGMYLGVTLIFDNYFTVAFPYPGTNVLFPIGQKCTAVAKYITDAGELFACFEPLIIFDGLDTAIELKPYSKESFRAALDSLDQ